MQSLRKSGTAVIPEVLPKISDRGQVPLPLIDHIGIIVKSLVSNKLNYNAKSIDAITQYPLLPPNKSANRFPLPE